MRAGKQGGRATPAVLFQGDLAEVNLWWSLVIDRPGFAAQENRLHPGQPAGGTTWVSRGCVWLGGSRSACAGEGLGSGFEKDGAGGALSGEIGDREARVGHPS